MKVKIEYNDTTSVAPEEIVEEAKRMYGESVSISILPDSDDPFNLLYFAIQSHITMRQVHSYYDDGILYEEKLKILRRDVLSLVDEVFDVVVSDNEDKLI